MYGKHKVQADSDGNAQRHAQGGGQRRRKPPNFSPHRNGPIDERDAGSKGAGELLPFFVCTEPTFPDQVNRRNLGMTATGIPSLPSMCRKGMDFVAYWASSRVPPVLLSAPAVWSTVHQLLCASLIPLTFPPTSMIVVVMRRPAGERSWGTEQRAKRIDLGRDPRLCLREPICSVAGRETARSSYSAKSMSGGFRCSEAKHRSATIAEWIQYFDNAVMVPVGEWELRRKIG